VLGQLTRRLRSVGAKPMSQVAVLSRLDRLGPHTASALAAAERMRPQSMAHVLADLQADGLVARTPDTEDRRQVIYALTPAGRTTIVAEREQREDWLSQALATELSPAEQNLLVEAVTLLRRLAEG
jgi:DNA-binding MarR family transcriptional regulator